MKKILLILSFFLTFSTQAQTPAVVTTVGMIADVAENVGGECVEVTALMGPGVDPHLYKASAGDVRTLQNANLVLYSGYSLEGQLGEVLDGFARRKPVVAVSEAGISEEDLLPASSGAYSYDPHVWMDVTLWSQTMDSIANALGELAPDCADAITENAETYKSQLAALDEWVAASITSIPESRRILVTAHDAFAYYGRAYDIEVEGIQGISTESEASLRDIRTVADTVAEREVPALFVESSINPRTIEAVLQAVQDRGFEASIGGQLFSDAMGENGTADGTYIGMIYSNTRAITEALGGTVAPLPEALNAWAETWNVEAAQ